jgi:hypothetical protein
MLFVRHHNVLNASIASCGRHAALLRVQVMRRPQRLRTPIETPRRGRSTPMVVQQHGLAAGCCSADRA